MRHLISVIKMSNKDLWHDARMTLCLVLTVASITLPLLLFFGLKNGVVEVMRQRMINDPSYMEIIPQGTAVLDDEWFEEWSENEHIAFLVPKTRELGVNGTFQNLDNSEAKSIRADMQPTGDGDWLLKSYQINIPQDDACVLNATLAEKLQATKGDIMEISISRQKKGGGIEYAKRQLRVEDILPPQALGRDMAFVPLELLEKMEEFRDGFSVEEYGWQGEKAVAYPVFYSAILYTKEEIDPILKARIQQRSGFAHLTNFTSEDKKYNIPEGWYALRLETGSLPVNQVKIQELKNLMRGKESVLITFAGKGDEFSLTFVNGEIDKDLELKSLPAWSTEEWQGITYDTIMNDEKNILSENEWNDYKKIPAFVFVSENNAALFPDGVTELLLETIQGEKLNFTTRILPSKLINDDEIYAPIGLIAQLNLLVERELNASEILHTDNKPKELIFELGRQSYSRFRMYAKSLDDVAPLAKKLEETGLVVKTKSAEIERVRMMDQYLTLIIGIIAGASVVGGVVCLLASLYASVERKRRSLAVLRLLGINGFALSAFPLTAGLIITGLGFALALAGYHVFAHYINITAQDFTLPGETLCSLSYTQQTYSFILALAASIIAGLSASLRLLKIEPSEGLRDE